MPRRARHGRRQRLARRHARRRSPTSPVDVVRSPRNGGFSYGCNLGAARGERAVPALPQPRRADRRRRRSTRSSRRSRADPAPALVGPRILDDDGDARLEPAPLPAPALDLRPGALPAPRCWPRRAWTDELVRDPAAYERPAHAGVGLRRLHARPPRRLRGDRRLRRGLLPLLRGHRPLPAPVATPATRSASSPRAVVRHVGGASSDAGETQAIAARSRVLLRAQAPRPRAPRALEALGVALGEATHALAAAPRPGLAPRAPGGAAGRARPRATRLMRVLYSFPTRLGTPGIGTTAWHQVAGLAEHGVEVTVVAARASSGRCPPACALIETLRPAGREGAVPAARASTARSRLHDRRAAALLRRLRGDGRRRPHLAARRRAHARRRPASSACRGLLERPNAHTAFAFAAVEEVRRELGLAERPVEPARPPPRAAGARGARVRGAPTRLLCPSEFVAAHVPRRRRARRRGCCATATATTRRASAPTARDDGRRPVHGRLRRPRRAAQGPAPRAAGVAGLRRGRRAAAS